MQSRLLAANVHGKFLGTLTYPPGSQLNAVGKNITKAFPVDYPVNHRNHRIGISPGKLDAIGIRPGDNAVFVAFHGKGNDVARRYGIQSAPVAHIIQLEY